MNESERGNKETEEIKYNRLLQDYHKCLEKYEQQLEKIMSKQDQMAAVQMALDLTYLKEELDTIKPVQDRIEDAVLDVKRRVSELESQHDIMAEQLDQQANLKMNQVLEQVSERKGIVLSKLEETARLSKETNKQLKSIIIIFAALHAVSIIGLSCLIMRFI